MKYKSISIKLLWVLVVSYLICMIVMAFVFDRYNREIIKYPQLLTHQYNLFVLIPLGITIGSFILVFLLMINKRVRYFKYIIDSVKKINSVEFLNHLDEKGNDEITELAHSINVMNNRIQDSFIKEKAIEDSKYELITSVSHDLKTPLTSILGYLELLEGDKEINDETRNKYISITYNKGLRLKELINELFEYTKLTGADVCVNKTRYNISPLINQMIGESIIYFEERNVSVILENPYKELYTNVDSKLLSRVFENIIKNAEKYSSDNSDFKVILETDEKYIYINFINKCEGINSKSIEKIFDKFYRLDDSRNSEKEGSGLGLTIAKRIMELHNGDLLVESESNIIRFIVKLIR